ncbi:hypothetical protein HPB50_011345 [Hyalomma asiaticum]|uniref:Uncharacterized protein n=1 Tax=Hyalomma asiaticum TaxID=266040 RepID=A0ACB7RZM4_HYAAI|nr:hypothetical protein HPB50_011345 [Hyalomma asiaticum]
MIPESFQFRSGNSATLGHSHLEGHIRAQCDTPHCARCGVFGHRTDSCTAACRRCGGAHATVDCTGLKSYSGGGHVSG